MCSQYNSDRSIQSVLSDLGMPAAAGAGVCAGLSVCFAMGEPVVILACLGKKDGGHVGLLWIESHPCTSERLLAGFPKVPKELAQTEYAE
eukprot:1145590-Pelagomonas_calceolata.AAC.2